MHVEPTGSCPPVQPPALRCCPACQQVKPCSYFATTPGGASSSSSSSCRDCRRTVSRLASRRQVGTNRPKDGGRDA
jgi:hypothetical protein